MTLDELAESISPVDLIPTPYHGELYLGGSEAIEVAPIPTLHMRCAVESPPDPARAVRAVHLPLDDDPKVQWVDNDDWCSSVIAAALCVAREVKLGGVALVTCHMGLNRSGLVAALALCHLGYNPSQAVATLREYRSDYVLNNPRFLDVIRVYGPIMPSLSAGTCGEIVRKRQQLGSKNPRRRSGGSSRRRSSSPRR